MCGRIIQSFRPLRLAIVEVLEVSDSRMGNIRPRYNAAPSQELLVIRQNHKTGERSLDLIEWGLIPHWCTDPKGGRRPINAKAESVSTLPMFRDAYAQRRCIVPVDGFFEWRAIKGARAEQPYAMAMKDGSPFGLAGLWENWRNPTTGAWERTFVVITVSSKLCPPMTWWARSMTACPQSWLASYDLGLVPNLIRAISSSSTRLNL
jgi:putative SOS response-associated peptidase YedK